MVIQLVQNVVSLILIGILSLQDIRYKQLKGIVLIPFAVLGFIMRLIASGIFTSLIASIPGLLLILFSLLTDEKLGYGDGITILGLCLWLNIGSAMRVLMTSMSLLVLTSLILIIALKISRKNKVKDIRLPVIPYILAGLVVMFIFE